METYIAICLIIFHSLIYFRLLFFFFFLFIDISDLRFINFFHFFITFTCIFISSAFFLIWIWILINIFYKISIIFIAFLVGSIIQNIITIPLRCGLTCILECYIKQSCKNKNTSKSNIYFHNILIFVPLIAILLILITKCHP